MVLQFRKIGKLHNSQKFKPGKVLKFAQENKKNERVERSIGGLGGGNQMPPEIAAACHVHECPESRSYCRQHLSEKDEKEKTHSASN